MLACIVVIRPENPVLNSNLSTCCSGTGGNARRINTWVDLLNIYSSTNNGKGVQPLYPCLTQLQMF